MTTLYISDITEAISNISVAGVTVKDVDELAGSWVTKPNILYPNPNGSFITGFNVRLDTMLQGANAPMTFGYTLNYRFLGAQVGDMATFSRAYSDVVTKLALIVNAIIATPAPYSGRIEMVLGEVSIGAKEDPAGNMYHGADFALNITEMQN